MNKEKAITLLDRYFHWGGLNEKELKELIVWLEDPENKKVLDEQIEVDYLLYGKRKNFDADKAYDKILSQLEQSKRNHGRWNSFLKYAAILIMALGTGFYFYNLDTKNTIKNNSTSIILELGKGDIKILQREGQEIIVNKKGQKIGTRNGSSLIYSQDSTVTELVYNTLYVPKGKTFKVQLSDGTKIIVNADTEITYPVNFLPSKEREIRLRGEAYFQVAKDSLRPFIAHTRNQKVRVYGTTFNIKAYPEDLFDKTVLVEGLVGVSTGESEVRIIPGEMASTRRGGELEVQEVDIDRYTAWTQDRLVFKSDRFEEIIKVLERKFDVEIDNKYEELNAEKFTAKFNHEKKLEQILKLFSESRPFKFRRENNHVIIYKPEDK